MRSARWLAGRADLRGCPMQIGKKRYILVLVDSDPNNTGRVVLGFAEAVTPNTALFRAETKPALQLHAAPSEFTITIKAGSLRI